jgi:hypothetical protein
LRLETDAKCDKKKSELYFGSLVKKILTEISREDVDFCKEIAHVRNIDGVAAVAHPFSFDAGARALRHPLK